jgi:hypothetical protein
MKRDRVVIANHTDGIIVTPFSQLRAEGTAKIFLGKSEVAADLALSIIRLLPDRRYRQYLATRYLPGYRPDFWKSWLLDAWHISTPLDQRSLAKVKKAR